MVKEAPTSEKENNRGQVWLIESDGDLIDDADLYLDTDIDASTLSNTDFMSPDRWPLQGTVVARLNKGSIKRLDEYDWYPSVTAPTIVSDRLRLLLLEICPDEVAFHPAQIRDSKNQELKGWCPIVLNRFPCTDIEKSVFYESNYINGLLFLFKEIRFLEGCLRGKNIVRNHTTSTQVLISEKLKDAIQKLNPYGIRFLKDYEIEGTAN